jgi:TonB family protein
LQSAAKRAASAAASYREASNVAASNQEDASIDEAQRPVHDGSTRGNQIITWVLGAMVFACAIFLITGASLRFFGSHAITQKHSSAIQPAATPAQTASVQSAPAVQKQIDVSKTDSAAAQTTATANHAPTASTPAGGLTVYENGKEVFHLAPVAGEVEAASAGNNVPANAARSAASSTTLSPRTVKPKQEKTRQEKEDGLIRRVDPEYPEAARNQKIQGPVVLEVRVAPDGAVQKVTLISGPQSLADSAIAAVQQWRFRPHRVNGQPVPMQTRVTLDFKLP